jgi:TatD DNase family protein
MFVGFTDEMFVDTHTHLYLEAFTPDRDMTIRRALDAGVSRMLLPNIDVSTIPSLFQMSEQYAGICLPMMGLHPTSVKQDYKQELAIVEKKLDYPGVIAVGEIGIDLYWDQTYVREQEAAFRRQIGWAKERDLPIVIHARNSFQEIFRVLDHEEINGLNGVFHSFTGNGEELKKALSYGFMIGINGIVTFKNSDLSSLVPMIPQDKILLETDAPFLAPVPFRGKRNESSYLVNVADRVAEIYNLTVEELGGITTRNAELLFKLSSPK